MNSGIEELKKIVGSSSTGRQSLEMQNTSKKDSMNLHLLSEPTYEQIDPSLMK